jgi:hypothetical protein
VKHRFSNRSQVRREVLARVSYDSWAQVPQALRTKILEAILEAIEKCGI